MERHIFVKKGVLRLPPGFRFHPTDEELVMQYLRRKVLVCPLPASIIPEVDVCKSDPWDLPGDAEEERYFFSTREAKYPNGNRSNRATVSGYWKATGIDRKIVSCKGTYVVGMKKTLVFYRGKPPTGSKTDWIMHEYRLADPEAAPPCNVPPKMNLNQSPVIVPIENWVLCRIFLKKRSSKADVDGDKVDFPCKGYEVRGAENNVKSSPVFYDFLTCDKSPSSSGSSEITRVASNNNNNNNHSEDNEESSSCNSFSFTYLGINVNSK